MRSNSYYVPRRHQVYHELHLNFCIMFYTNNSICIAVRFEKDQDNKNERF